MKRVIVLLFLSFSLHAQIVQNWTPRGAFNQPMSPFQNTSGYMQNGGYMNNGGYMQGGQMPYGYNAGMGQFGSGVSHNPISMLSSNVNQLGVHSQWPSSGGFPSAYNNNPMPSNVPGFGSGFGGYPSPSFNSYPPSVNSSSMSVSPFNNFLSMPTDLLGPSPSLLMPSAAQRF